MRPRFVVVTLIVAAIVGASVVASAQQKKEGSDAHDEIDFDGPGPAHQKLAKLAGDYTTATKFTMSGAPGQESSGTATLKMILGGRFLSEESTSRFMGEPTQGMHLLGYNNAAKKYEAVWVYTGSTAFLHLSGTSKDDGKTLSLEGSFDDGSGGKTTLRVVILTVDADHLVETLKSVEADGSEGPTLETTYTRKK